MAIKKTMVTGGYPPILTNGVVAAVAPGLLVLTALSPSIVRSGAHGFTQLHHDPGR